MAQEIEWVRNNAKLIATEAMVITTDEAVAAECAPGTYKVERFAFQGVLPFRMARKLSGAALVSNEYEHESLRLGTGYRGGEGVCEFIRTVYTREAA